MMPLSLVGAGEENTIKKIGGSPEVRQHLAGNVIVNVKEARVAISQEMANKIMV